MLLFLLALFSLAPVSGEAADWFDSNLIEERLHSLADVLTSDVLLAQFYEARQNQPAWLKKGGVIPAAKDLINAVQQSDREGLSPEDYHLNYIRTLMDVAESSESVSAVTQAELEVLLTDAFLTYGSHLLSGSLNPYEIDSDWFADRRTGDLPQILKEALIANDVRGTLKALLPAHPIYQRLRDALARYRTFEKNGGWPTMPAGSKLRSEDSDDRVPLLRQRLYLEGDINQKPSKRIFFDRSLKRGLVKFQKRHGLEPDGILGPETLAALNVPVEERVRQLRVNMERLRWLPEKLGARHLFVNVPDFQLEVMEDGKPVLDMKVVVGRKLRQTPVFSSTMTYIVLNPNWTVPINVAKMDILDHVREEPDYLTKNKFHVYDGYDDNAAEVDPTTINWSSVTAENLAYKFRQDPGPQNALGRIKFMFPNRFDVYLHDTPSRSLFKKNVRDFSSGCIRLEKPLELAEYVLAANTGWNSDKITNALKNEQEQHILVADPIRVHLMYLTAWVDSKNKVQFRNDIYGRDRPLSEILHATTRSP